ncbi:hypothetical protein GCM10027187_40870 [Streptosporangium sandarakinum]|uniref:Uncharacterized protein n=1 Tax=Streptosporangium sandarakinum TaxID=1260955 RepID=A0A852VDX8_9ACTN|nr:hypothetical protein [Streptosporangium sandarakinum]NYF44581.1 hypothetical protein [Streptosporangium sandarakinum]
MVHRIPGISEALLRAGRSLLQNLLSVAVVAGGAAVVTAGEATDAGTLGVVGGQAAVAAVLAYVYNRIKPAGAPGVGEVRLRAGRSLLQNVLAGAIVAGGAAAAGAASGDLRTILLAVGQAAAAAVISAVYNVARPLAPAGEAPAM